MLFNSAGFIFVFLPITLVGFYLLGNRGLREAALGWLILSSLIFYGWWNPFYLLLLGSSVVCNYLLGLQIAGRRSTSFGLSLLIIGLLFNLILLGYYKYAGFLGGSANYLFGTDIGISSIVLPLAISFFTFQQIAYLVDVYQDKAHEYSFSHYFFLLPFSRN